MINKSATVVGTIEFKNGNKTVLHIGNNRNTGETIVWQVTNGGRSTRTTGKNIAKLCAELNHVLSEGTARWLNDYNIDALIALNSHQTA